MNTTWNPNTLDYYARQWFDLWHSRYDSIADAIATLSTTPCAFCDRPATAIDGLARKQILQHIEYALIPCCTKHRMIGAGRTTRPRQEWLAMVALATGSQFYVDDGHIFDFAWHTPAFVKNAIKLFRERGNAELTEDAATTCAE